MYRMKLIALATAILAQSGLVFSQSERLDEGREAFAKYCSECHEDPTAEAPTAGDQRDWKERSELWEAVLFEHAQKGYLKMPAKGGADNASDYDVEAAAEYMLTTTHPEMPHD